MEDYLILYVNERRPQYFLICKWNIMILGYLEMALIFSERILLTGP